MNVDGKSIGSGVIGVVIGIVAAMAGGDGFSDIAARVGGNEETKPATIRVVKRLCAMPEAQRNGELIGIHEGLDGQSIAVACTAEEVASGPPDTEEVTETAAEVVEEAQDEAEETAAEVEAEIEAEIEELNEKSESDQ